MNLILSMKPMLTCNNLSLEINNKILFDKLGFTAVTGSLLLLRGANGSGKTSLLKLIAGLLIANYGNVSWNGVDINEDLASFRQNVCFISTNNSMHEDLTVFDNLDFWCRFRGEKELFLPAIRFFQIEDLLDEKFSSLSSGQKRRVELTKLLLYRTNLWLLDEPDLNLDKKTRGRLIDLIKVRSKEGGVVIMTTHNESDLNFANFINLEDFKK